MSGPAMDQGSATSAESGQGRRGRRRPTRRLTAVITVGIVVLSLTGWGTGEYLQRQRELEKYRQKICPGLAEPAGDGFELSVVDGECIGWTNEAGYAFSPEIKDITTRLTQENDQVRRRWTTPPEGKDPVPYVRIAVLMPLTANDTSAMTSDTIKHSLEGILTAQARANEPGRSPFRDATPAIQVVLANAGRSMTHWQKVVDALTPMTTQEHPLEAVVGLGVSIEETRAAAEELSRRGIPSVGAVLTSTEMTADRLFKVSPSNKDYAAALGKYLGSRPDLHNVQGYLVYDSNNDSYVRTLRTALYDQFNKDYNLQRFQASFAGTKRPSVATPVLFAGAVDNICHAKARVIFYAGRDRDMRALLDALSHRDRCGHDQPIVIATGATGFGYLQTDAAVHRQLVDSSISIIDASSTNVSVWREGPVGSPRDYRAFHEYFHDSLKLPEESLDDGYAVMHHDALATVIWATRLAAEELPDRSRVPSSQDIYLKMTNLHGTKPVPAASGELAFDDLNSGWPHDKPVAIIQIPADPPIPLEYRVGTEYKTP